MNRVRERGQHRAIRHRSLLNQQRIRSRLRGPCNRQHVVAAAKYRRNTHKIRAGLLGRVIDEGVSTIPRPIVIAADHHAIRIEELQQWVQIIDWFAGAVSRRHGLNRECISRGHIERIEVGFILPPECRPSDRLLEELIRLPTPQVSVAVLAAQRVHWPEVDAAPLTRLARDDDRHLGYSPQNSCTCIIHTAGGVLHVIRRIEAGQPLCHRMRAIRDRQG